MTEITPPPAGTEGADQGETKPDVVVTSVFHLVLLIAMPFLWFVGSQIISITGIGCANCADWVAIALVLVWPGLLVAFGLSVVVSVVLLMRRKNAWFVPVAAGLTMLLWVLGLAVPVWFADYGQ